MPLLKFYVDVMLVTICLSLSACLHLSDTLNLKQHMHGRTILVLKTWLLTAQGRLGDLFDARQLLTDVSGSGNNWAHGHHLYGPQYREDLLESIRRPVEACESLQSFLLLQSLGGGTGSGLGCYILNLLEVRSNICLDSTCSHCSLAFLKLLGCTTSCL